jgi:hypothetical protein
MDHDERNLTGLDGGTATSLKERVRSLRLPQKTAQPRANKGLVALLSFICL